MEKIWLKNYPDGIPAEVPEPPFRSLRDLFEHSFSEYADRPAYTNMGTTITYRELDELSMQFAGYLQGELGLTRGERVAIMLPNILQYPVVMCGIFRAGLVVVNVNPLYTARELQHQLTDSGARAIIVLENFAHTVEQVIDSTKVDHVILASVGEMLKKPKGWIVDAVIRHVKKAVPKFDLPSAVRFRKALARGGKHTLKPVELGFADIAFLQYTGGTTGVSKGAMLSHRNMLYNVAQTGPIIDVVHGDNPISIITALPLYHIYSLQSNCLCISARGGLNILITNPRDMPGFVKELAKHSFTTITGVNTLFTGLLNTPGFADLDFSSLRSSVGGGMAVQPAIAKRWKDVTGVDIDQGYGLTETSPVATAFPPGRPFNGSVGLPVPSTDVMLAGDDGNPLPLGEIGEICIKGPQGMEAAMAATAPQA